MSSPLATRNRANTIDDSPGCREVSSSKKDRAATLSIYEHLSINRSHHCFDYPRPRSVDLIDYGLTFGGWAEKVVNLLDAGRQLKRSAK
jgi:hypothetical protein